MKPIHTLNKMSPIIRQEAAELLNRSLASTIDLRYQAKEAHWNVRGPEFRQLHKLFDRLARACDKYQDQFAERVAQLGFTVDGRIQDAFGNTQLEEYPPDILNGLEHAALVAERLSVFCDHLAQANHRCEEIEEAASSDIFVEALRSFDVMLWMIEAHLLTTREMGGEGVVEESAAHLRRA